MTNQPHPPGWTFSPIDAGMGETEYNVFYDGVFFARVNNRADVAALIYAMKNVCSRPAPPLCPNWIIARVAYPDGDKNEWCCGIGAKQAAAQAREDLLKELIDWAIELKQRTDRRPSGILWWAKIQSLRTEAPK